MLGLLIFNHLNDVLYMYGDLEFLNHVRKLADTQGLSFQESNEDAAYDLGLVELRKHEENIRKNEDCIHKNNTTFLDPNIIVQLFSPLVTSQHLMDEQFGNSYSTILCEDETVIVFQEYKGCLFICIGTQSEAYLKRFINVSVQFVQLVVGLSVSMLQFNTDKCQLLDKLVSTWLELYSKEQCYLVEAIERLVINPDVLLTAMNSLATVVEELRKSRNVTPVHAVFFIGNKLLSLYSSEGADDLSGSDLLLLNLLAQSHCLNAKQQISSLRTSIKPEDTPSPDSPENFEGESDGEETSECIQNDFSTKAQENGTKLGGDMKIFNLLMKTSNCDLAPHIVYLHSIKSYLTLIVVTKVQFNSNIGAELLQLASQLESIKNEEIRLTGLATMENIEVSLQKSQDLVKRLPKSTSLKAKRKLMQTSNHWESIKNCNLESWIKSSTDVDLPSRLEACLSAAIESTKSAWQAVCLGLEFPTANCYFEKAVQLVREKMDEVMSCLEPKCFQNMSLGSRSIISVNKYLDEFPGLVHFLYIDRTVHQLTAPTLWMDEQPRESNSVEGTSAIKRLTCSKIWAMVDFAREHLSKGHTSLIWKDKTFSYSYFLWFEDVSGNPLKSLQLNQEAIDSLPIPGVICGDFYNQFASKVVLSNDKKNGKIYELFCIHLGLTTSPCILEQTRRLAATIWEIAGPSAANPVDLL